MPKHESRPQDASFVETVRGTKRAVIPPRNIEDFRGDAAFIACSHNHTFCTKAEAGKHTPEDTFTIDISPEEQPDLICDMTKELDHRLRGRFSRVFVESLDVACFGLPVTLDSLACVDDSSDEFKAGQKGFNNLLEMLNQDGYLCIYGCLESTNDLYFLFRQGIKHARLSYKAIIIPKNQEVGIAELKAYVKGNDAIASLCSDVENLHYYTATINDLFAYRQHMIFMPIQRYSREYLEKIAKKMGVVRYVNSWICC